MWASRRLHQLEHLSLSLLYIAQLFRERTTLLHNGTLLVARCSSPTSCTGSPSIDDPIPGSIEPILALIVRAAPPLLTNVAPFKSTRTSHVVASAIPDDSHRTTWTAPSTSHFRHVLVLVVAKTPSVLAAFDPTMRHTTNGPGLSAQSAKRHQAFGTDHLSAVPRVASFVVESSHRHVLRFDPQMVADLFGARGAEPQQCSLLFVGCLLSAVASATNPLVVTIGCRTVHHDLVGPAEAYRETPTIVRFQQLSGRAGVVPIQPSRMVLTSLERIALTTIGTPTKTTNGR